VVISASRKTDIPAFYGDWLLHRLEEGYCVMRNSYSRRPKRVSLAREDVDAFVFWTKNPKPFLPALAEIARRGFPFYMHVTVTGYGPPMERSVASWESIVECCRRISETYGPRTVIWRYDPIVLTDAMTPVRHEENFAHLPGTRHWPIRQELESQKRFGRDYPDRRADLFRLVQNSA